MTFVVIFHVSFDPIALIFKWRFFFANIKKIQSTNRVNLLIRKLNFTISRNGVVNETDTNRMSHTETHASHILDTMINNYNEESQRIQSNPHTGWLSRTFRW